MYNKFVKRIADLFFALLLLIIFSPIILLIYVTISVAGGSALFSQRRIGLDKKIFKLYKFRTMIVDADKYIDVDGQPSIQRVTKLGKILRVTSLDELPQLINIIRGEMSFIGPRPVLMEWSDKFNDKNSLRFAVRPGITGYAQVNGRNMIPWSQRVAYDAEYVSNISLLLDIRILVKTVLVVLKRENISLERNSMKMDDL